MKLRRKSFLSILVLLLVIAMTALSTSCKSSDSDESVAPEIPAEDENTNKRVDQVTIAIQSSPDTLNPYNVSGAYGDPINDVIYDKFFDTTYTGELINRLCTDYDVETDSEDNTVLTFYLDDGAKWHDGEPVTAKDVVFTAKTITNPETVTTRRFYWSSLLGTDDSGVCKDLDALGVKAIDDHTVQYTLKGMRNIDAYITIEGRFQYILPEHLLGDIPAAELHQSDFWKNPVGSGPFKFKNMTVGERYEFSCNTDYYGGLANMDNLVYVVMSPTNYATAFASGQIDANTQLSEIPIDDWQYLQTLDNIETKSITSYTYQWMNINQKKDYFKNSDVRKAFSMAINRNAIIAQLLNEEGTYAVSSIPPSSIYFNKDIAADPYNPEQARTLLENAGWDFNHVIDMVVPIGNKVRENSTVLIQQDLEAIGVKSKIRNLDFATIIVEMREGNFDFGFLGGLGTDPDDVRLNFDIKGSNNFSHLDNTDFYEVLDKARSVTSVDERKKLYAEWQEMCLEETPIVWLYHPNTLFAYNKDKFDHYPCEDSLANNMRVMEWTFK